MKILAIADEESKFLWDFFTPDKLDGIDLIISCGDLRAEYLEFLVTMGHVPVLYVPGNHDTRYEKHAPEGCECIDGKIVTIGGIRILGFGGSMKYGNGPYMYTEEEMKKRIKKTRKLIVKNEGIDILVTHSPANGYGDMDDIPHRGYQCFNSLLEACRPRFMLHGHVHATYGKRFKRVINHPSGTRIINCFDRYVVELDKQDKTAQPDKKLIKKMISAI